MARTATLTNLDRAEYGTVSVDLDLLQEQIAWLADYELDPEKTPEEFEKASDFREGILNLLGGIMDLADPPEEEGEADDE